MSHESYVPDVLRCEGRTTDNRRCGNWAICAVDGRRFCHITTPAHRRLPPIEAEAPGPDVPIRRRAERAIVRGLKYIGGFKHQAQVGRADGSFTVIADDEPTDGPYDPDKQVTVYAREGAHRPVCLDDVLDRLRDHGEFRHGEHAANYIEKERREGRL